MSFYTVNQENTESIYIYIDIIYWFAIVKPNAQSICLSMVLRKDINFYQLLSTFRKKHINFCLLALSFFLAILYEVF